jgi:arginase family enzyme
VRRSGGGDHERVDPGREERFRRRHRRRPDLVREARGAAGVQVGEGAVDRALDGADAVYVALDCDAFEPDEVSVFMPEPDGLRLQEVESLLAELAARIRVAGVGFTGLVRDPANEPKLARLAAAAGL